MRKGAVVKIPRRSKPIRNFGYHKSHALAVNTAQTTKYADVAELADALVSGTSECTFMWVQVPSSAPKLSSSKTTELFFYLNYINRRNGLEARASESQGLGYRLGRCF